MEMKQIKINKDAEPSCIVPRKTKTKIRLIFMFEGEYYRIIDYIDDHVEKETVTFLYLDGNYSDDETRRDLINKAYQKEIIPKLKEGSKKIDLVKIEIEYI